MSSRTDYRTLRKEFLLRIQEKIGEALAMSEGEKEKLSLPTLKEFFNFLNANVKVRRIDLESFYKRSKKSRSTQLPRDEVSREGEDFNYLEENGLAPEREESEEDGTW